MGAKKRRNSKKRGRRPQQPAGRAEASDRVAPVAGAGSKLGVRLGDHSKLGVRLGALTLLLAAAIGWSNGLDGAFVFDDLRAIPANPTIRSLSASLSPPPLSTVSARPVTNLSLAINYRFGGLEPRGYHVVNVALHLLAGLVLFGLLRRTLLLPSLAPRYGPVATGLALSVALLWLVHPLQTESVTYIVQRCEVLSALFYLLTLYLLVRGATAPAGAAASAWRVGAVLACALGMASKEVTFTAPLVALAYDRIFLAGSFAELWRKRRGVHLGLAATWLVLVGLMLSIGFARTAPNPAAPTVTPLNYFLSQPGFILRYLAAVVWPAHLVFDYGVHLARGAGEIVPQLLAVSALGLATIYGLWRRPAAGFCGLAFFLILGPTSSFWPTPTQVGAEHRLYLPLAAVLTLVVVAAYHGWLRLRAPAAGEELEDQARHDREALAQASLGERLRPFAAPLSLVALVAAALLAVTRERNLDYRSSLVLWRDTIEKWPTNARAHKNLGRELLLVGKLTEAREVLERAVALRPRDFGAISNRAIAHRQLGDFARALADFDRALALRPDDGQAHLNRGTALGAAGRNPAAIAAFTRALALDPSLTDARFNRGNALLRSRRPTRAIADYDRVLAAVPGHLGARTNRAIAHLQLGQVEQARADVAVIRTGGGQLSPALQAALARHGR